MAWACSGSIGPFAGAHHERRACDALPLLPMRPRRGLAQRLDHHLDVEARPPRAVTRLEAVGPRLGAQRRSAEERHGRVARRERHRPAPQRRVEVSEVGLHDVGRLAAVRAGVGEDQAAHQVRARRGEEQRRPPSERLADEHHRAEPELLHGERGVVDVRAGRHVGRMALAAAVPARIESDHAAALGQPPRRLGPLPRVAGQPVQEQDGRPVTAMVEPREAHALSLDQHLGRHRSVSQAGVSAPAGHELAVLHDVIAVGRHLVRGRHRSRSCPWSRRARRWCRCPRWPRPCPCRLRA